MTDYERLLRTLVEGEVRFILVGGFAGIVHGAARLTQDLDVVYARDPDNLARLAAALAPYRPYPRGAPAGLPFRWDSETLRLGLNFTLITDLGALDLLGEIAGGGTYEDLAAETDRLPVFGFEVPCLRLKRLIEVKRAAGRPKDFEAIAELETILDERGSEEKV